jgi:hypothetical protein
MIDSPGILGFFLAIGFVVVVVDIARGRRELFDERVTAQDRQRLMRLAMFVLLPLSVLAHEGGHALAVKAYGGEILDFGFYFFYGYVSHRGFYTPLELAFIAFAGPFVNIILGLGAIALAWFWPRRPAVNYLLFVFGALELLNAVVFYPLLDAMGGVAGDWETIYSRDTPVFSTIVGVCHIALLVGAAYLWRSPRFQEGYAQRTGARLPSSRQPLNDDERREIASVLSDAASTASTGWKHDVSLVADAQAGGTQIVLRWESGGFRRALLLHASLDDARAQRVELHAAIQPLETGAPPLQRPLARIDGQPTTEELTPYVRRFLDFIDDWNGSSLISPN